MYLDSSGLEIAAISHALPITSRAIAAGPNTGTLSSPDEMSLILTTWTLKMTDLVFTRPSNMTSIVPQTKHAMSHVETQEVHTLLRTYLPSRMDVEIPLMFEHFRPTLDTNIAIAIPHLAVIIYLLSNNLLGDDDCLGITRVLRSHFQHLLSIKLPTFTAAADNVFLGAVCNEDLDMVQHLLEAGVDPNNKSRVGTCSALGCAVTRNNLALVRLLLKHGANVNARSYSRWSTNVTALQAAILYADVDVARLLLESGAEANTYFGTVRGPPLEIAILNKRIDHIILLAICGADIYTPSVGCDACGESAFQLALSRKNSDITRLLATLSSQTGMISARHVSVNSVFPSETLLHRSARLGDLGLVIYLVIHGWDVNNKSSFGVSVLQAAIWGRNIKVVLYLLASGAQINTLPVRSRTALLCLAVLDGITELIAYCLQCGADVNGYVTPIRILHTIAEDASLNGYHGDERMDALLDLNGDMLALPNSSPSRQMALQLAVRHASTEIVYLLLQHGADVNYQHTDPFRHTPIELALRRGDFDVVHLLITFGANISAADQPIVDSMTLFPDQVANFQSSISLYTLAGEKTAFQDKLRRIEKTMLEAAVRRTDLKSLALLLDSGADINVPLSHDQTALHLATKQKNTALFQFLLDNGADINVNILGVGYGQTILGLAVQVGDIELVKLILRSGADVECQGPSALTNAVSLGNIPMMELLLGYGITFDYRPAFGMAARTGRPECLRLLLKYEGDVNITLSEEYSQTLILTAIDPWYTNLAINLYEEDAQTQVLAGPDLEYQDADMVLRTDGVIEFIQILLERNGNLKTFASKGANALDTAIMSVKRGWADIRVVQYLLDRGADTNAPPRQYTKTALGLAIDHPGRHTEPMSVKQAEAIVALVRLLLTYGADANAPIDEVLKSSPLQHAIYGRREEGAKHWIARDALRQVGAVAYLDIIRLLFSHGADINAGASLALEAVVSTSSTWDGKTLNESKTDVELVKLLLSQGTDATAPPTYGLTLIQNAVRMGTGPGEIEVVRMLLAAGADVNGPSNCVFGTALQIAADRGTVELIELLLDHDADINAASSLKGYERTALQAAADGGNFKVVELLLRRGADVNAPACRIRGVTALQAAAIRGCFGIVVPLLEYHADVNAPGAVEHGRTALEGAAEHGRLDIVKLLLNSGVDIQGKDDLQYQRAVGYARKNGYRTVARMIESWVLANDT